MRKIVAAGIVFAALSLTGCSSEESIIVGNGFGTQTRTDIATEYLGINKPNFILVSKEQEAAKLGTTVKDSAISDARNMVYCEKAKGICVKSINTSPIDAIAFGEAFSTAGMKDAGITIIGSGDNSYVSAFIDAVIAYEEKFDLALDQDAIDSAKEELELKYLLTAKNSIDDINAALEEIKTTNGSITKVIEKLDLDQTLEKRLNDWHSSYKRDTIGEQSLSSSSSLCRADDSYFSGITISYNYDDSVIEKETFSEKIKDLFSCLGAKSGSNKVAEYKGDKVEISDNSTSGNTIDTPVEGSSGTILLDHEGVDESYVPESGDYQSDSEEKVYKVIPKDESYRDDGLTFDERSNDKEIDYDALLDDGKADTIYDDSKYDAPLDFKGSDDLGG